MKKRVVKVIKPSYENIQRSRKSKRVLKGFIAVAGVITISMYLSNVPALKNNTNDNKPRYAILMEPEVYNLKTLQKCELPRTKTKKKTR